MNKKQLIERINNCSDFKELKSLCCEHKELDGLLDEYVDDDGAIQYIKQTTDSMIRLYYTIRDLQDYNAEFYHIDNYGNIENSAETLDDLKQALIDYLE